VTKLFHFEGIDMTELKHFQLVLSCATANTFTRRSYLHNRTDVVHRRCLKRRIIYK